MSGNRLRHGHTTKAAGRVTPEYRSWRAMRSRCLRYSKHHAEYYGMHIHPEWIESFEAFLADMGPRPNGCTLDRIDNSLGYMPSNCRWATFKQQAQNRRSNVYAGTSVEQVAASQGLNVETVRNRLRRGYSPDEALTQGWIKRGHGGDCVRGEKNSNAKLNDEKVKEILTSELSGAKLAEKLGVSKTTINMVRQRKIWRHVNVKSKT